MTVAEGTCRVFMKTFNFSLIVDGKTTSWFVLPLLVVNISNFSGNFSVTSVDKKTYENVCGIGTDVIFINYL